MAIKLGNTDINKLYLGSTEVKKAYLGSTLVFDSTTGTFLYNTYPAFYGISSARILNTGITYGEHDRRSSDDAESDVGFISNEKTLLSPVSVGGDLTTWVGVGDAFTEAPLDQSGNAFVVEQLTKASQPQVVSSGALVTSGGKAAFDNTSGLGWSSTNNLTLSDTNEIWIFAVLDLVDTGSLQMIIDTRNTSYVDGSFYLANRFGNVRAVYYTSPTASTIYDFDPSSGRTLLSFRFNTTQTKENCMSLYINGVLSSNLITGFNVNPSSFVDNNVGILSREGSTLPFTEKAQEFHIYKGDQSSNRAAIEANINSFYNIY